MRIVLDTNVFVSGVFFAGPPHRILRAWREGRITLVLSADILAEYHRIADELAVRHPSVNFRPIIDLLTINSEMVDASELPDEACADPDDLKFIACALAGRAVCLVSGDHHLLAASGYRGVRVLSPRDFVAQFLAVAGS